MSKVLVFDNSYVCWKNEDIRIFYAHGKECD